MSIVLAERKKESKAPRVEGLGPPFKEAANGWTNYACPFCADGKPNHFWLSPEGAVGVCHKCGWRGRVRDVAHRSAVPVPTLVSRALLALGRGVVPPSLAVPGAEELRGWEPVSWAEVSPGAEYSPIYSYAHTHHLAIQDLVHYGVRVLERHPREVALYFPSSTLTSGASSEVQTAQIRVLQGRPDEPRWQTVPALPSLERICYPLPHVRQDLSIPLVLVESPADVLRVQSRGLCADALMGTVLTDTIFRRLQRGARREFLLLLDADALDKAVQMQTILKAALPRATVLIIPIAHDAITGKARDPCDLSDDELDELLRPFLTTSGGTTT